MRPTTDKPAPLIPAELGKFVGRSGTDRLVFERGVIDDRGIMADEHTEGDRPVRVADVPELAGMEAEPETTWITTERGFLLVLHELGPVAGAPRADGPRDEPQSEAVLTAGPGTIEGSAAAARALGKSPRTIRRWLDRCPPSHWPSASRPGRQPAWRDQADLEKWWATRRVWRKDETPATQPSPGRPARARRASAEASPGVTGVRARLIESIR